MLYSCYNALNLPCFTVVLMLYKSRKLTCFEPEQYVLFPLVGTFLKLAFQSTHEYVFFMQKFCSNYPMTLRQHFG